MVIKHRLLAVNVDGTLLQDNGRLNKKTKEAIEYVVKKGIHVTIVTARAFPAAKQLAKSLRLDSALIAHSGAFIAEEQQKPVLVKRISEKITVELVQFLEQFDCQIRLVHEQFSMSNKHKLPENLLGKVVLQSSNRFSYSERFVECISEKLYENPVSPPHVEVHFNRENDLLDVEKSIEAMYEEVACIHQAKNKLILVSKGISKLKGLLYVCERLGIQRDHVVAIGSGIDDLPMLEWAGLGVAMGNAHDKLIKAADWVTRSHNDNGVYYMVKEHFRKQHPIDFLKKMNVMK